MDLPEILAYTDSLDREAKAMQKDVMKLIWYMRGSVTLDEAYMLSYEQREIINTIIEDNLETTKETGLPFF
jgi:hypothetical protein